MHDVAERDLDGGGVLERGENEGRVAAVACVLSVEGEATSLIHRDAAVILPDHVHLLLLRLCAIWMAGRFRWLISSNA